MSGKDMLEEFKIRVSDGVESAKFQSMMFDNGIFWKFHLHKYKPLYINEHYLIVKDDVVLDRLVLVCADEDVWNDYEAPEYKMAKYYNVLEEVV